MAYPLSITIFLGAAAKPPPPKRLSIAIGARASWFYLFIKMGRGKSKKIRKFAA
jgi:hypothetical protein